jgi:hypothetical protein
MLLYGLQMSEYLCITRLCNDTPNGRNYQLLLDHLSEVERANLPDSIFYTAKKFKFEYRPYCLLENPISVVIDRFHWGVAQITDTRFLYEHSSRAFCGQQSKFMADIALHFQIPFRYIHFGNHVAIELFHGEKWNYYDPSGVVYFNEIGDRASFSELKKRGDLLVQPAQYKISNQIEILPKNYNFFYRLELFNSLALYVWWFSLPFALLWTFRSKWMKIFFK